MDVLGLENMYRAETEAVDLGYVVPQTDVTHNVILITGIMFKAMYYVQNS